MKKISGRCRAIYEPLQLQCIHTHRHDGPHACYHQEDLHLWHDSGEDLFEGSDDRVAECTPASKGIFANMV